MLISSLCLFLEFWHGGIQFQSSRSSRPSLVSFPPELRGGKLLFSNSLFDLLTKILWRRITNYRLVESAKRSKEVGTAAQSTGWSSKLFSSIPTNSGKLGTKSTIRLVGALRISTGAV